jgi:hypothetical protein
MKAAKTQILFFTAAVMFGAAVLRLTWVENAAVAEACRGATDLLCQGREGMALLFHYHGLGWAALALGALALWRKSLSTAMAALLCSGLALVFYSSDMGAGGFVLGLIGLARAPSVRPMPPQIARSAQIR